MSEKQGKKIGLVLALMMLIGSVVGIGIFFKNGTISRETGGNGISWLIAWIIGGIISIAAALNFAEIGTMKKSKLSGLSSWIYRTSGTKIGYGTSVAYAIFYWGLLLVIIPIFSAEMLFYFLGTINVIDFQKIKLWVICLTGIGIGILFYVLNWISLKISGYVQTVVTILKFIPLLLGALAGIIFPYVNNNGGTNAFVDFKNTFSAKGIVLALPAVLFSYDAFLVSGSIGNKIKNANRNLPLAILIGMITIVILYSLIAISSILHNSSVIWDLLKNTMPANISNYIVPMVVFFILVSSLGVTNGISAAFSAEIENLIDLNVLFGSKWLKDKIQDKAKIVYWLFILLIWNLMWILPSAIIDSDALIDGVSNYPTAFFMMVYAYLILTYTIKRNKINETQKINKYLYYIAAFISVVGIAVVKIAYLYAISENLVKWEIANWGLFKTDANAIKIPLEFILYIINLLIIIIIPFINFYLEKWIFKRNILNEFTSQLEEKEEKTNKFKNESFYI
ncbi:APC family permease [Mesomycoplasma lagogenitalium]|uniref:APC family permease n=1 Tax=Mesomycoplasma lagogenitalium TaxID=171286 RepID=A0ABY8LTJ8_9BACT|nr:APC family permease [Mesomycoplasma lagogenitalium]WGI36554.1 APC family permease [Mesomycoplasma lagogenitalium]